MASGALQAARREWKTMRDSGIWPHTCMRRAGRSVLTALVLAAACAVASPMFETAAALEELRAAVNRDETLGPRARLDTDFEPLYEEPVFLEISRD